MEPGLKIHEAPDRPTRCVQATPDCVICYFLRQAAGAPDAERWAA